MAQDPRNKRFFELQKKDMSQLNEYDIKEYLLYCDKMIEYSNSKKARRGWIELKKELEFNLHKLVV